MTTKIERLKAWPIKGNYHDDRELFDLAHEIIVDPTQPLRDRFEALWCIDRATGVQDEDWYTEQNETIVLNNQHGALIALADYLDAFGVEDAEVERLLDEGVERARKRLGWG